MLFGGFMSKSLKLLDAVVSIPDFFFKRLDVDILGLDKRLGLYDESIKVVCFSTSCIYLQFFWLLALLHFSQVIANFSNKGLQTDNYARNQYSVKLQITTYCIAAMYSFAGLFQLELSWILSPFGLDPIAKSEHSQPLRFDRRRYQLVVSPPFYSSKQLI